MIYSKRIDTTKGFSLVELLVVMVIMGLVITSIYSLFLNTNRTAVTTEEVVDVQQNLRVAMDSMVADIRMAGFLVSGDNTSILAAPPVFGINTNDTVDDIPDIGGELILSTISEWNAYARILRVDSGGFVLELENDGVFKGGDTIRVVRPSSTAEISSAELTIGATIIVTATPPEVLIPVGVTLPGAFEPGDIIVRKISSADHAVTVRYMLRPKANAGTNNFELIRYVRDEDDGNIVDKSVIATNITTIDLTYLTASGTSTIVLADIRAIRIDISAQTDNTKTGLDNFSGTKTKSLQTVVKIRNVSGV